MLPGTKKNDVHLYSWYVHQYRLTIQQSTAFTFYPLVFLAVWKSLLVVFFVALRAAMLSLARTRQLAATELLGVCVLCAVCS